MNYDDDDDTMPPAPGETMGVWAEELADELVDELAPSDDENDELDELDELERGADE